jgi:putative FmdB family regulatory protein
MPVYEYQCESCGKKFDIIATLAEKEAGLAPVCPKCGGKRVRQVFSRFTLLTGSKSEDDFDADEETGGGLDMGGADDGLDDYGSDDLDTLEGSGDLDDI